MKKFVSKLTGAFCLATMLLSAAGCQVDKRYAIDDLQESIDLGVTLFEKGLRIPVGSTDTLVVDSLLTKLNVLTDSLKKYLQTDENGYLICMDGNGNLNDAISELDFANMVKLEGVSIDQDFEQEIDEVNKDDFTTESQTFGNEITITDLSEATEFNFSPIDESFSSKGGLNTVSTDISIPIDGMDKSTTIFSADQVAAISTAVKLAHASGEVNVSDYLPVDDITVSQFQTSIPVTEIPSDIKSLHSVTLDQDAQVTVTVNTINCILSGGSIVPDITFDASSVLQFEGGSGQIDLSELVLNASHGFSNSKSYKVSSIRTDNLNTARNITAGGKICLNDIKTSSSVLENASGAMEVEVIVEFENIEIESVVFEINPIEIKPEDSIVNIYFDPVTLPDEVKDIDAVYMTDASGFDIRISGDNILEGMNITLDKLEIEFPERFVISGEDVSGHTVVLNGKTLANGSPIVSHVNLDQINLPDPVNSVISLDSYSILVHTEASVSGTIDSADLPKTESSDLKINVDVNGGFEVGDYDVVINEITEDISDAGSEIRIEVSEEAAGYGTVTVFPEGDPAMTLSLVIPDLGALTLDTGDGIVVNLPSILNIGTVDPELNFDAAANTITLTDLHTAEYSIPIESITVTPVKGENGKYESVSSYSVDGAVTIAESHISKETVDKLSGATISMHVEIPGITAESVNVESLSVDIDEHKTLTLMAAEDIPAEVVEVNELGLEELIIKMSIDTEGLPDIGDGTYNINVDVTLPDFINPSSFNISGQIDKNGHFDATPIDIETIDLSAIDFAQKRQNQEDIAGEITFKGTIEAINPTVDLNNIQSVVNAVLHVTVGDDEGNIVVNRIKAKVDYPIKEEQSIALPDLSALAEMNLDLPPVDMKLEVKTNLDVPFKGKVSLDGTDYNLNFPTSDDPAQTASATTEFSIDLNKYIREKTDSIKLVIDGSIDTERYAVIDPNAEYSLEYSYSVKVPVQLGDQTDIAVRDTLALPEGIGEILAMSSFGIEGQVESTLPFNVMLNIGLLSYDKATDTYTEIEMNGPQTTEPDIKANSTSELSVIVSPKDKELAGKTTHLLLDFGLTSDGSILGPDNYIRVSKLSIVLPEGITVEDINSFVKEK